MVVGAIAQMALGIADIKLTRRHASGPAIYKQAFRVDKELEKRNQDPNLPHSADGQVFGLHFRVRGDEHKKCEASRMTGHMFKGLYSSPTRPLSP